MFKICFREIFSRFATHIITLIGFSAILYPIFKHSSRSTSKQRGKKWNYRKGGTEMKDQIFQLLFLIDLNIVDV